MRTGWVTQLRQFYFIKIPERIKLACLKPTDRHAGERDTILVDPYKATKEEVRWIKKLAEEIGEVGVGRMFERLGKYFDGKSAKEKILKREQVDRPELEGMVEAVKKAGGLVIAEHW